MKTLQFGDLCSNNADCSKGPKDYSDKVLDTRFKKQNVVGIAKDGRMIYGPYKDDGSTW